jgi:hypothetical protein
MLASCGTGPSIAETKLDCAERRAGGTSIPNQRNGSTLFAGFLSSSVLSDGLSTFSGSSFESLRLGSLVLAAVSSWSKVTEKLSPSSLGAKSSACIVLESISVFLR